MTIRFSSTFKKRYDSVPATIKAAVNKRIELFCENPHHPILRNHKLSGALSAYRSINITGDWRVLYTFEKDIATFEALGTHSQLYR